MVDVLPSLDLHEYRSLARDLSTKRAEARRDHTRYSQEEADAERDFRKRLAIVFAEQKAAGKSDRAADLEARAQAADLAHRRDIAKSLALSARFRIEECERASASLRHISERSERES